MTESDDRVHILHVCGARPNFMKVAPVMAAVEAWNAGRAGAAGPHGAPVHFSQTLVHTGQHYDDGMSDVFFRELGLPRARPLPRGRLRHARRADGRRAAPPRAGASARSAPDLVLVVGDVNSTLAAALCAAKLQIPVAHVEAGLRSGDREMPEELNRLLTDQLAELLFTTRPTPTRTWRAKASPPERIHFVGNTMIDTLERLRARALEGDALGAPRPRAGAYALVTLHRPSNVDDPAQLERARRDPDAIAQRLPVLFPVHAADAGAPAPLPACSSGARGRRPASALTEPLATSTSCAAMASARLVLTDSGGVQEETTVLGVPCLTLRTTTERPVTVTAGTNRLVDPYDAEPCWPPSTTTLAAADAGRQGSRPPLGTATRRSASWPSSPSGQAAERQAAS